MDDTPGPFLAKSALAQEMHTAVWNGVGGPLATLRKRGTPTHSDLILVYSWAVSITRVLYVRLFGTPMAEIEDYCWAEANFLAFIVLGLSKAT